MAGLDSAIHDPQFAQPSDICAYGTPWMPGSSPGMTVWGVWFGFALL